MNIETGIIADDFTGAGDSSIFFCQAGYSVYLPLTLDRGDIPLDNGILAINTESRLVDEEQAYRTVSEIIEKCRRLGVGSFYKKIDSTLRGNIGSEVQAVMDKAGYEAAVICPAAPDVGRTVVDGQCLIHGTPINRTEAGKDHLTPVKSADIKDLFKNVESRAIAHISTSEIDKGITSLKALVDALVKAGKKRIICDAASREQLNCIASLYEDSRLLLVGAAGLARAVSFTFDKSAPEESHTTFENGHILVASGSRMEVSRNQVEKLARVKGFSILTLPITMLLENDQPGLERFWSSLEKLDDSKPLVLIPGENEGGENPEDVKENSEKIAGFIGEITARLIGIRKISVLVTVGGHTTYKIMRQLNAEGVLYQGEVIHGTPYGQLVVESKEQPLMLVTKSGSFGNEDALVNIVDFVKQESGRK